MAHKNTQSSLNEEEAGRAQEMDRLRLKYTSKQKRLKQEMMWIGRNPTPGILWCPRDKNLDVLTYATAAIIGPENTSWAGGVFFLSFYYSNDYPRVPPRFTFETQVFHPNINARGVISMDILGDQWAPHLTSDKVLLSIQSILDDPLLDVPALVPEAAELYKRDRPAYEEKVKDYTKRWAM